MNRTGEVYRGDQVRNLFVQTHTSGVGFNLLSVMKILKKNLRHYVDTSIE